MGAVLATPLFRVQAHYINPFSNMDQYDDYSQLTCPQRMDERLKRLAAPVTPITDFSTSEEGQGFVNEQEGLHSATWTRESHAQHQLDGLDCPLRMASKQMQGSRNPTPDNRIKNRYDRLPSPPRGPRSSTAWPITQGAGPSSANENSSSEALCQRSSYQGSKADHEASPDQLKESRSTRMKFETARQALYSHRSTQSPVRNASRSIPHYNRFLAKPVAPLSVMPTEPAIPNTGTRKIDTHLRARKASHSQLSHTRVLAEAVTTPDVMQSNAFFQNARGFKVSGNPTFQNIGSVTNVYGGGTDGLEGLKGSVSFDAQFDSSAQDPDRQCHPGTRQNVLKRLRDWFDNSNSTERISWLYGPAGAGKSAIAQTIAHSYSRPKVAGTFFFFRSDVKRNDGNLLFTTLAYQLALSMLEIRDHITHSLSERPDLPRTRVETQFEQLLSWPFQVLCDDSTQQLAPAVHAIKSIVKKYRKLAPVIIIDGVDECIDENLQRRFLKVIGDAVKDDRFPIRFLIVSRPELHIEQTIHRFQTPILAIDLAGLDDANRDIEKYLTDEFSRIASEQGLDQTWPGPKIIHEIVYKSSGNFIFASLVIRFVSDPYFFAKTQLEIVLNMKPLKTMSPFAILDQLFLEILKRVPDQEFLKRYLALLVARIPVSSGYGGLHQDDAVLMHLSEEELHANLRRMRSLLRFKPHIDFHHKSFLDFLHNSSRSGQYHIREQSGIRGYLEVFVDSLVRYVSAVIEQPKPHNAPHFAPRFRTMIKDYPPKIELPGKEWQEVTQPLLDLQDKLLQLPNFASVCDLLPCDQCTAFHLLRELLHLGLYLGFNPDAASVGEVSTRNLRKRRGVISSITDKTAKNRNDKSLDSILLSLFAHLPETPENWSPNKRVIDLMSTVLRFDCTQIVMRVVSLSDAQKLVDLLDYLIHAKNALHPDARGKASLLALKIFARVPIVPLSYFLNGGDEHQWTYITHIQIWSQTLFAHSMLDHLYIKSTFELHELNLFTMYQWRQTLIPSSDSSVTRIQMMFRLAKAIQYLHSMGVVLDYQFCSHHVLLDSDLCPKIRCLCSTSQSLIDKEWKERFSPHDNISSFGDLCYEMFAGADHSINSGRSVSTKRSSEIPGNVWQLIQRCCSEDSKCRPTIDEVVEEIEGWSRVGHTAPSLIEPSLRDQTCFKALRSVISDLGRRLCQ